MSHVLEFKAMGCQMLAVVDSPTENALKVLDQVPSWFEQWEQSLSRFRPDSELNRVNASAGWPTPVSETFRQVLKTAVLAEQSSAGLVTPVLLDALEAAGYDRSFETLPIEGGPARRTAWSGSASLAEIKWDEAERSLCLPSDMRLDFGGVAKGWAADQAARRLALAGPALVSAGGDIAISGPQLDGSSWPIGVDDPFHPGQHAELLMVASGGVATSGTDYRRWKQGGRWNHHIIDPRSGLPAQTDVYAATVIAVDAMQAEMAAKRVLISGSREGLEWLEANPGLAGLLILENGQRLYTQAMQRFVWRQS